MFNRRFSFTNSKVRSATALLVLVSICASLLPIPLGRVVRQIKDLSQPFPCQHCACGCKTAEQCWSSCCCYTPAQKAAWAKENGVTPPSYAQQDDDVPLAANCESSKKSDAAGCCSKKINMQKPTETKQVAGKPTCPHCVASTKSCETESSESPGECANASGDVANPTESVMVLSIMAYKCSGQANVFSLLPWAIIETQADMAQCWELHGRQRPSESFSPIQVFLFPDVPPPRTFG